MSNAMTWLIYHINMSHDMSKSRFSSLRHRYESCPLLTQRHRHEKRTWLISLWYFYELIAENPPPQGVFPFWVVSKWRAWRKRKNNPFFFSSFWGCFSGLFLFLQAVQFETTQKGTPGWVDLLRSLICYVSYFDQSRTRETCQKSGVYVWKETCGETSRQFGVVQETKVSLHLNLYISRPTYI